MADESSLPPDQVMVYSCRFPNCTRVYTSTDGAPAPRAPCVPVKSAAAPLISTARTDPRAALRAFAGVRKHCRKQHSAWLQSIDAEARDNVRQPSGSRSELYCIQRAVQREWIEQRKRARTDGDAPADGGAPQAKQAPSASGDARKPADPRQGQHGGSGRQHSRSEQPAASERLNQWVERLNSAAHVPQQQQWGSSASSQPLQTGGAAALLHGSSHLGAPSGSAAGAHLQPRPGSGGGSQRTAFFTLTQQMPPPLKRGESLSDFDLAGGSCSTPTGHPDELDPFSAAARLPLDDALSENTPPPSAEASFFAANVFA